MLEHAKKIYVIGGVGSGKTTIAKKISIKTKIKCYALDDLVWKRNYPNDIKRTDKEIDILFTKVIRSSNWIIEDTGRERFSKGIECADTIILLDINKNIRLFRILKRWIMQKIGLEKASYNQTLSILKKMYKWNNLFEKNKPVLMEKLNKCRANVITINKKNYNEFIKNM